MSGKSYAVVATASEGWWSIEVPEVPGALSQGRSHEEVVEMARDAISLILEIPIEAIEVDIQYRGSLSQAIQ